MVILSVASYVLIYIFSYILSSPRPQRAFLSLIRRYFRSTHFLASEIQNNEKTGHWRKFKIAFYRYELRTLPLKIKAWSKAINPKGYPENSADEIEELLMNIYSLSSSLEEWLISNRLPQTELILTETREELAKWDRGIERIFKAYYNDLDSTLSKRIEDALMHHINTLESIINKHDTYIKQLDISPQEKENFYHLLGSYLGLSRSLISYAAAAEQINWKHWEEEVFA
jgi:hypothetical protein